MIEDARETEDEAVLDADLAVVGAGAAGIAIALHLAGKGLRVLVLEGGGRDFDGAAQDLYIGRNAGLPYHDLDVCRLRQLGGTTNHWWGRSRPLEPFDFEPRPWIPHSGWPIAHDDFAAHLPEAQRVCGLAPEPRYDPEFWDMREAERLPVDPAVLRNLIWQFGPGSFADRHEHALATAEDVTVLLHAHLVEIVADPEARHVEALRIARLDGARFSVRARAFVLAAGGLENARLLLASDAVRPDGLGNDNGLVGAFFMEHPHLPAARLLLSDPDHDPSLFEGEMRRGTSVMAHLALAPEIQAEEELLGFQCQLSPDRVGDSGFAALRRLLAAARGLRWPDDVGGDLGTMLREIDDTAAGVLGRMGLREYRPDRAAFVVWTQSEQAPDRASRVFLDRSERDALGMPRLVLDWRLGELERRTIVRAHHHLARQLGLFETGRLRLEPWLAEEQPGWPASLIGGAHHMGTTRMSHGPDDGVVDPDCRVHGIDNLYVAGSSVFPTSGCVNPTLSLVALALRLAAHLQTRLRTA